MVSRLLILNILLDATVIYLAYHVSVKPIENEKSRKWYVGLFIFLLLTSTGLHVWQQMESNHSDNALRDQITTLLNASRISATTDDIAKLDSNLEKGLDKVVSAINGKSAPKQTPEHIQQNPIIENTQIIQKPTISNKPNLPYGLQVIIQSNITIQPTGFGLQCDGEIGDFGFFIAGQGAYLNVHEGHKGNTLEFGFSYPPLTPENSLVVTIFSKTQIKVISAYKLHP